MKLLLSVVAGSLLFLCFVPSVFSKGHGSHTDTYSESHENAANQTCNTCCRGPPGRDGRDGLQGPIGNSSTSLQDYLMLRKELERELKQKIVTELEQSFASGKLGKCKNMGKTSNTPASSCKDVFLCDGEATSAQYWIRVVEENSLRIVTKSVYCNMEDTKCGIRGGWMRVAHIDMTNPSATCPPPLRTITSPKRMCGRSAVNGGCSSVTFPSCGVPYTRVCGRAVGYAFGSLDGFGSHNQFEGAYVDGLSITHGQPRKHIWTYAAGASEDFPINPASNCPCAVHPGSRPPFDEPHYHCESGNTGISERHWYPSDPLWDGKGCVAGNNCCLDSGLPWFCRTLPCETTDDIEVRWCADEAISNEDVATELLEIFVQ